MSHTRHAGARLVIASLAITALAGLSLGLPQAAQAGLIAIAVNDTFTAVHDRAFVRAAPGVLANDLNLVGGSSAVLVSGVSHGTLALLPDGGFTYAPAAGYVGGDSFRYRISGLVSTPATVTITVTNRAPVATADAYATPSRTTLVVPAPGVLGNDTDADGDALVAELVSASGISGSLDLDPGGRLVYSPGGGASGTTSFSYRVWDGAAWSSPTTVSLTITAPTATPAPTPPPTPTSAPTTAPTAPPTPIPTAPPTTPTPRPTPGSSHTTPTASPPPGTPRPASGTASPQSTEAPRSQEPASAQPTERATQTAGPSNAGVGGGTGPSTPPSAGAVAAAASVPPIRIEGERVELANASIGLLAGVSIWAVPAATIAGPGLLVLVWVAIQATGAMAWVPSARRLRGAAARRTRSTG